MKRKISGNVATCHVSTSEVCRI